MRLLRPRVLIALLAFSVAGCEFAPGDWGDSQRFKEEFSHDYKLSSGGRITLESFNGSVEILGWDQESVSVTGTKYASREEVMRAIKIDVLSDASSLRVRAVRPLERNCNCGARFLLKVPRKVMLDRIETSNGSLRVESIEGDARLQTSNGSVKVWSVAGDVNVKTSNGAVELQKFNGRADLKTSNGSIKADDVRGGFSAETSNGSISATLGAMDPGRPVVAETSNASVTLNFESWKDHGVRVRTSNGSVNIGLPAGVNAQVRADTSHGRINSDFELAANEIEKDHVDGRIGQGGPLLELRTTNGNIRLMKR
jgi:hypothetical protein